MSVDVSTSVVARYYIDKLTKEISNKQKELVERWETLQRQCSHPTIKVDKNYHEGGYDYISRVKIIHTCTLCDKRIKIYDDPEHKGTYA